MNPLVPRDYGDRKLTLLELLKLLVFAGFGALVGLVLAAIVAGVFSDSRLLVAVSALLGVAMGGWAGIGYAGGLPRWKATTSPMRSTEDERLLTAAARAASGTEPGPNIAICPTCRERNAIQLRTAVRPVSCFRCNRLFFFHGPLRVVNHRSRKGALSVTVANPEPPPPQRVFDVVGPSDIQVRQGNEIALSYSIEWSPGFASGVVRLLHNQTTDVMWPVSGPEVRIQQLCAEAGVS